MQAADFANVDLYNTIVQAYKLNPAETAAQVYLAVALATKNGVDTALTMQSLHVTKGDKQAHSAAAKGSILSKAASDSGCTLSAVGKAVTSTYRNQFVLVVDAVEVCEGSEYFSCFY